VDGLAANPLVMLLGKIGSIVVSALLMFNKADYDRSAKLILSNDFAPARWRHMLPCLLGRDDRPHDAPHGPGLDARLCILNRRCGLGESNQQDHAR